MKTILQLLCLMAIITTAFAAVPDTADRILMLYRLSSAQEAQFSDHDSAVSSFWSAWEASTPANIKLDFINIASDNPLYAWNRCATSPFSGGDDAQMIVRGAYSDKGAYFYFDVVDDKFVEPAGWGSDVVDVFMNAVDSKALSDPMNWCGACAPWTLSFAMKEFQVSIGDIQKAATFNYRYYDDLAMSIKDHTAQFSDAAYDSTTMEIIRISTTHKIQEWFIPWSQISPVNGLAPGSQCAFACGYNDADSGTACTNSLRWVGLCDPSCEPPNPAVWGDVEFGPCLDANGCSNAARNPLYLRSKIPKTNSRQDDLFNLKGEHVSPSIKHLNNRILIRHKIGTDGTRQYLIKPQEVK